MRNVLSIMVGLVFVAACGGTSNSGSEPGPIVDNLLWVPSQAGEEFFGPPPEDATCPVEPEGDCPVPEDDCVVLPPGGSCVVSFVPECFDQFTVLSVYTQRPTGDALCNWITLEQPLLREIRAGDEIEVRAFHFALNFPAGEEARLVFVIGDEVTFETSVMIPRNSGPVGGSWVATKDIPAGTPVLFHVDNHGANEYLLIEANLCEREVGDDETPCFL